MPAIAEARTAATTAMVRKALPGENRRKPVMAPAPMSENASRLMAETMESNLPVMMVVGI